WHRENHPGHEQIEQCPLCDQVINDGAHHGLMNELMSLRSAPDVSDRALEDTCRQIRQDLIDALPQELRGEIATWNMWRPKKTIVDDVRRVLAKNESYCGVLTKVPQLVEARLKESE